MRSLQRQLDELAEWELRTVTSADDAQSGASRLQRTGQMARVLLH